MPILLYFIAVFCLSQSAHWVKWSGGAVALLGFWRLALAVCCWLPFANKLELQQLIFTNSKIQKTHLKWALTAGFFFFLHLWTFQYAAQHTRIANLMILFVSNPLWTAGLTALFLKERPPFRLVLAYSFSVAGILLLLSGETNFTEPTRNGDLAALASALFYSVYLISSRQTRKEMSNPAFSVVLFSVASGLFLISVLGRGDSLWPENQKTWIAIVGLTVMSTLIGHSSFTYLVKKIDIHRMSCGKLIEPILASITAFFLFGESLRPNTFVAFACTAFGVLILFAPELRPKRKQIL